MRQRTPVTGGFLAAALVASGLLGSGLLAGCQRQESPQPSGQTGPTTQASPPAPSQAAPGPAAKASPAGEAPGATAQASPAGAAPVPPTPASVQAGRQLFMQSCASCHGYEGKGDGPAAATLDPKPANLSTGSFKYGGSPQEIFKTISSGVPGTAMTSWALIPEKDRWNLVDYVLSLSGKR